VASIPTEVSLRGHLNRRTRTVTLAPNQVLDAAFVSAAAKAGISVLIRINERKPTPRQRGYYFGVVVARWAEFSGDSRNGAHEAFKRELLGLENPDRPLSKVRSTASLTPPQYVAYVDQCVALAQQMGCDVPPPDPAWRAGGYLAEMGLA
jgi:hypothetical protein